MEIPVESLVFIGIAGVFIGFFGGVFGGAQFFAYPLFQFLFPGLNFGQIVGNAKMGGFLRGAATVISTRKHIDFKPGITLAIPALLGTFLGASFIANLSAQWMLPAIVIAIIFSEIAPKISHLISKKHIVVAGFCIGVYAGLLGAGIGILFLALLRAQYPTSTDVAHIKIQARFIEFLSAFIALGAHILHDNMIFMLAFSWGFGAFIGGFLSGEVLKKMKNLSGTAQMLFLRISFIFAFVMTIWNVM